VVRELREHGKPFAIVLNSKDPSTTEARRLADELEKKYRSPVALVSCPELDAEDVSGILSLVLSEFPVTSISFELPEWTEALPREHALRTGILSDIRSFADEVEKLGDIDRTLPSHPRFKLISSCPGDGTACLSVPLGRDLLYETMSEVSELDIHSDKELFETVSSLAKTKKEYEKIAAALSEAENNGYGIVMPRRDELRVDEPRVVKSAGGYGVRLAARGESLHLIKTEVRAEMTPVIGSEEQAGEVVKFLTDEYTESPDRVLGYNMLGRSVYDMVSDAMSSKLSNLPSDSRTKLGETLGKIINEGANGLICILL
jgi:stage IV sporulation protein A